MKSSMREKFAVSITVTAAVSLSVIALGFWLHGNPGGEILMRVPGKDGAPAAGSLQEKAVDLTGTFTALDGTPSNLPGAWTQFRGSARDNIVKQGPALAGSWGEAGPKILWRIALGEGHAGAAVLAGRVYVLDYSEDEKADVIRCFSLEDGREIWQRAYSVPVKRNHGMSRTIPAVTEKYLVTMGPRCHVVCLDSLAGTFRWGIDLQREYGTEEPLWYTGQCPLIEAEYAILAPAGPDALLMAVDCGCGRVAWKTPNPDGWKMSHSSVMPMTLLGKRMYVYCAIGGIAGVSAEAADAGALLWRVPWNARVVAPSPVQIETDKVFMTAGYGEGGMMIQVMKEGEAFSAKVLDKHGPKDGLACEQQTPILWNGLLYGIMPKDAGPLKSQFVCYRPDGTLVWSSGQEHRFGLGPFIWVDQKFYVLDDEGVLTMLAASPEKYEPLGQAKVLQGRDAWAPIAVAGTRMLMRDDKEMVCIEAGVAP